MRNDHVIVIGGGVIGAASAYYLAKSGWQVTVVDQGAFGRGCSHGNCGIISPSHVLPLAAPGALWGALRAMMRRNAPFSIKPSLDLGLWRWLAGFARRCTMRNVRESSEAIQALLRSSRTLYDELMATDLHGCEWETRGLLFVLRTEHGMAHFAETDRLLRELFDMLAVRFDGDAVATLEPALKPGLAGGWYYRGDAHLRPDRLMAAWRHALESLGVQIREQCGVTGFVGEQGTARAVRVLARRASEGLPRLRVGPTELAGEAFVVATGAWTPLLNQVLGCRIPIQPGKGYSMTMPRPARCPVLPMIFDEDRVAVTPMQSGYRLGSMMEFAGYDTSLRPRRLALLREGARHYLHEPFTEPVEEEWYGWRPMTPDSVPIIDWSPAYRNVLIAAGHNMLGVSMAPATGKLVAEMFGGGVPHLEARAYSLARF